METNYFDLEEITTLEELNMKYAEYVLTQGLEDVEFEEMDNEYLEIFEELKDKHVSLEGVEFTKDYGDKEKDFRANINKYNRYTINGLKIYVRGCYTYIEGEILNPKADLGKRAKELGAQLRAALKEDSFHYSHQKARWCWSARPWKNLKQRSWTNEKIDATYGTRQEDDEQLEIGA